ncbi:hypothetical protein SEA_SHROOMS_43 [Arthrobacter phage Shrooms]|nr:hypothetical protein SEA_SHROOMS_43 [Arthrobacter phage Shrooms]
MGDWVLISIKAEGWPRHVGPFLNREVAEEWMNGRRLTGSWNIIPMTPPIRAEHLGRE